MYLGPRAVTSASGDRYNGDMDEGERKTLSCGCVVATYRDFLGRVVGTIDTRSDQCGREDHVPGHTVLMPGREHAGPRGTFGA